MPVYHDPSGVRVVVFVCLRDSRLGRRQNPILISVKTIDVFVLARRVAQEHSL